MPKVNRYICFLNSLRHEDGTLSGVVVTDSNGAIERWGINKAAFPDVDVATLTFQGAIEICNTRIWPAGLDQVPSQILCNLIFDFGFNHGMKSAVMTLQKVLGVTQDGVIGPETLQAITKVWEPLSDKDEPLIDALASAITAFYKSLGGPDLPGWLARVEENVNSWAW